MIVRRFETEVELRSGQSFAIAGLYDRNLARTKSKIPVLGDIPLLGLMFRSKSLQRRKTELLVIVTPTIVEPLGVGEELPSIAMPEMEAAERQEQALIDKQNCFGGVATAALYEHLVAQIPRLGEYYELHLLLDLLEKGACRVNRRGASGGRPGDGLGPATPRGSSRVAVLA